MGPGGVASASRCVRPGAEKSNIVTVSVPAASSLRGRPVQPCVRWTACQRVGWATDSGPAQFDGTASPQPDGMALPAGCRSGCLYFGKDPRSIVLDGIGITGFPPTSDTGRLSAPLAILAGGWKPGSDRAVMNLPEEIREREPQARTLCDVARGRSILCRDRQADSQYLRTSVTAVFSCTCPVRRDHLSVPS